MAVLGLVLASCVTGAAVPVIPRGPGQGRIEPEVGGGLIGQKPNSYADYDQYTTFIANTLARIDGYWATVLPEDFDVNYEPLSGLYYYRPPDSYGPKCGGVQLDPEEAELNAFYCLPDDYIAWSEALTLPWYRDVGDSAVAFVLAHEWGHAIQARLGLEYRYSIDRELAADCMAGAWAGAMREAGAMSEGDVDEAVLAVYRVRDQREVEWLDPGAHGTAGQRLDAFQAGLDDDAGRCVS